MNFIYVPIQLQVLIDILLGRATTPVEMGIVAVLKNNKIGAVVVSVFDWYRKFFIFDLSGGYQLTIV